MAQFKKRLTAIAKRKGCESSLPDSWKAENKMAALMAAAIPTAYPKAAFDDPKLTGPTPLHIGDDRRVYGHVAVWDTCHVGIGSSCVKPPKSLTDYAYFHTGELVTDDGERLAVGRLTYGGGHAKPNLGYAAAAAHYDQTSNVGAYVRAGQDAYGIWVAGVLAPEADDDAVRQMRAAPLSGDWRRIGGNLEMVAALHVNTAGFPIPRMLVASLEGVGDEEMVSLTAAGALDTRVFDEPGAVGFDVEELGRSIARAMAQENEAIAERSARRERVRSAQATLAALTAPDTSEYDEAMARLNFALAIE
jgi:hypothetical protein